MTKAQKRNTEAEKDMTDMCDAVIDLDWGAVHMLAEKIKRTVYEIEVYPPSEALHGIVTYEDSSGITWQGPLGTASKIYFDEKYIF